MTPYYEDSVATIYHGDCREVMERLEPVDCVITDPVWPNSSKLLVGHERPHELLKEAAAIFAPKTQRLVVHLGCDSDPRILASVPASLPFLRVCWLEYACPTRKGRVLYTGDVGYVFGTPIKWAKGRMLMPGRFMATPTRDDLKRRQRIPHKEFGGEPIPGQHPCPRRFQHASWLVGRFADGIVLDPFMGSGTTIAAAKRHNIKSIGIEIEEQFCEIAARRLSQEALAF